MDFDNVIKRIFRGVGLKQLLRVVNHPRRRGEAWQALRRRQLRPYVSYMNQQLEQMDSYRAARGEPLIEFIRDRRWPLGMTIERAQFAFASNAIFQVKPPDIHDVGSHREWIMGVAAAYPVQSLDVKPASSGLASETVHVGRAEALPWESGSVSFLTSLCSIEHFGLTAYGDPYEPFGDRLAIQEFTRVVKPGGHLVLTTHVNRTHSFTEWNAFRVFALPYLRELLSGFDTVREEFFSFFKRVPLTEEQIASGIAHRGYDIYLYWGRKKQTQGEQQA